MGYLKLIEIENFKSWRGKQIIGPFMRFNCIIGPNGSGKSNIMDALSFATGERVASLRVKHLSDLIHGAHIGKPVSDTALVALHICDDEDHERIFSRTIAGHSSSYQINGAQVSYATYIKELEKVGIVTKAQNILVFQGAVEAIALKEPKERTKMLECICQSQQYAAEYQMKKEALLKAREDSKFHFNNKKSAIVEKKQVSQEKEEALKYQALVDDLNHKRLKLNLVELFYNEKSISAISETLREKQEDAAGKTDELVTAEQRVKAHKKEHGRLSREQQHLEKEIRGQEHILAQSSSQYVKAKVNTSHHIKKAAEISAAVMRNKKKLESKEQELEEGQQEMAELEKTWRRYERQTQEEGVAKGRDISLDEDQLDQYKELKRLAQKQAAVLFQQAEKLQWEVTADSEKLAFEQRRKKEKEAAIKSCQTRQEDLMSRAEKLEEYTQKCKDSLEDFDQRGASLSAELQHVSQRSRELEEELLQVTEELANARLDSHESRHQQQRREMLEKLRRLYPETVFGRLSDLCSPVHKKYQLAVTKVFGSNMNAIVVATEKVARECIGFLKEQRGEPETFLPVDYLVVKTLNQRLREIPNAKMVVDVVRVTAGPGAALLEKVMQYVCGNALVCETMKVARSVAFDRQERVMTVTLDGTLFKTSGVISGGSSDLRTKARCWQEKDMIRLKEHKDELMHELRDLVRLRRKESSLKQILAEAQGAQSRLKYSTTDLEILRDKAIPDCRAEISCLKSELSNLKCQIQMQQESLEAKDAEIKRIRQQIDQIEDEVFADFCAQIGVGSIREFEQEHLKLQEEVDKKRLEFESQRDRLKAQLEYNKEHLVQEKKKLHSMEDKVSKEEQAIAESKEDEKKLLQVVEEGQNKLQEMKNQLLLRKKQVASLKAELSQKTQHLQEINKELTKLQREVMSAETALEQKRMARHNMLLACKIQDLPISLLVGSLDEISQVQELGTDSESTTATMDIYEREAQLTIDYSGLEEELTILAEDEEIDAQMEKLKESVSSAEKVLSSTSTPNLKALEKKREVKDKLEAVTEAFNASTKVVQKCNKEFEEVKTQRLKLFNQCFEHVVLVIDRIYKKICRNKGAQAILSAENPEEPYLGGINYHCVAPGKRFMSMDNLSGGEKAIAALALLFAINSFRPAPFFILDEVDAALDNTNIGKVTSFIREESKVNMQIIVISLKEEFFSKADALLGVCSYLDHCMFSRILTLDLRPYPLAEEENDKARAEEARTDTRLESSTLKKTP
ncbi:structural maintenance of chromosomes protein 1B [Cyprinodon tularosa]|uniref:structural maintenance of chromosomes protein 1B n=1 Tax=Cyprinodon tularosa TaxID=77115 RepID=UPI0018E245BF|nr:structural maintenance of chromosomes protein 1B [Cyprinodon tularosa]